MSNYFKMDRAIYDHYLFADDIYSRRDAWAWMIANACWKEKTVIIDGKKVVLKRGQLSFTSRFLSEKWKWHRSSVQRFFARLETESMIEPTSGPASVTSRLIVTICNYDKYQDMHEIAAADSGPTSGPTSGPIVGQLWAKEEAYSKKEVVSKKESKGVRLALTHPPEEWIIHCQAKRADLDPVEVFQAFRDHWIAVPGSKGLKLDWFATWRNWVRNEKVKGKIYGRREKTNYYDATRSVISDYLQQDDAKRKSATSDNNQQSLRLAAPIRQVPAGSKNDG